MNASDQTLKPSNESVNAVASSEAKAIEPPGRAQHIATLDERNRYVAAVFSVVTTVFLATLLLSLLSELFDRTMLRAGLVLIFTILIWAGALNGMLQMSRHARPLQLGKKWIDISYGIDVIFAGMGFFVRDASPHIAIGVSHALDLLNEKSETRKAAKLAGMAEKHDRSMPDAANTAPTPQSSAEATTERKGADKGLV